MSVLALIFTIALECNLPPQFVISIALEENPTLAAEAVHRNRNGTYDRGVMQLNSAYFDNFEWNDPVLNIRAACKHITWLRQSGLNWWQTALAYNCGITGMKSPPDTSIEYANRVMKRWQERDPLNPAAFGGR